jgi:hypothetical protein
MKKITIISFSIFFLLLLSFYIYNNIGIYKYENGFKRFINDTFEITIDDIDNYSNIFIIPLSSCTPCVNEALNNICNIKNDKSIILLLGASNDKSICEKVVFINNNFTKVYTDFENKFINYETNIGSPTFLYKRRNHFYNKTDITNESFTELSTKYSF